MKIGAQFRQHLADPADLQPSDDAGSAGDSFQSPADARSKLEPSSWRDGFGSLLLRCLTLIRELNLRTLADSLDHQDLANLVYLVPAQPARNTLLVSVSVTLRRQR